MRVPLRHVALAGLAAASLLSTMTVALPSGTEVSSDSTPRSSGAVGATGTSAVTDAVVGADELDLAPSAASAPADRIPAEHWPADVIPALDWASCYESFECATATVPRDYDDLYGATLELAVIRKPAADPAHRIGSLFMNPGGPGASGVGFLLGAPPEAFELFPRFDIVSWDTRGVGASRPAVDCSTDAEDDASVGSYFVRPDEVDRDQAIETARESATACLERNPEILPYLSTANVTRDLDLLRAAVGDRQLTYLGISHGTHIGATYATLFPGRARAMIMDSPVDPEVWVNRPFESAREQLTSFEDALDRFFTACVVQTDECGFGGTDPEVAFDALVAEMNAAPLPAPNSVFHEPVTGDEVLAVTLRTMYSPLYWDLLATALSEARDGDASMMRDAASFFSGRFADGTWAPSGVLTGTRYQDGVYPRAFDPYFDEGVHAYVYAPHFFPYAFDHGSLVFDRELNPTPKHDAFRGPWQNPVWTNPVLVIAGTHDPATPYRWSERYVEQLGNARLQTYESDGHGVTTDLNDCIVEASAAYLETLQLPAEGAICTQDIDPFFASSARSLPLDTWQPAAPLVAPAGGLR